ncbi:MAG: hypothetical protein R2739_05275 [Chitinophagales bacterium]|nr:hypothetical protein [Bacteroidota bacterium]
MQKAVKNIIIRLAMLAGLMLFLFLMIMAKINRDNAVIKKINIEIDDWNGNFLVDKQQVLQTINNRFDVLDKSINGKELEKIEQALYIIPQIKSANAFADKQGNLNIKIEQRVPLFRVYNLQGQTFYVDNQMHKFATSHTYSANVPIVTGNISEKLDTSNKKIQTKILAQLFNVASAIRQNTLWNAMIGQYNINEKLQIELIPRLGNATILLGDDANIEQKLKQLNVFYFDVLRKEGWNKYKVINIMYKNQVVCLR